MVSDLNQDFSKRVVIETDKMGWMPSPMPGVMRKPLARAESESGHATSIVQYAPGSSFKPHSHPHGEEIFVLDGVFSDSSGDYPKGSYIRNPDGTRHAPYSEEGCVLFVKLCQFQEGDMTALRINTRESPWLQGQGNLQVMPLHNFEGEHTALVKWPANEKFTAHQHFGGEEILVLSGEFRDEWGIYPAGTWVRSPHGSRHVPFTETETVIWVKTGHLPLE